MAKYVYSGLEGSGKSLKLASVVKRLVKRNSKWFTRTGIARPIVSNMKFSEEFEEFARESHIPVKYWDNLDELIRVDNADVIIDELGNYFDSRLWADLSLDVRRWLTQGSKCGVDIYGSAQDFAQVDKSFRRLVDSLHEIRKIIGSPRPAVTKPPVKRIWGVCFAFAINPRSYKEDEKEYESGWFPSVFFIHREDCEIFNTGQKILRSKHPAMRHEIHRCEHHVESGGNGECNFCRIVHI